MFKYLIILSLFALILAEDCQSNQYLANGSCFTCVAPCTKCNSSTICTACDEGYTPIDNVCTIITIIDCIEYNTNKSECTKCKYGTPFAANYSLGTINLSGLCKCPKGRYKLKITGETVKYECATLNISIIFDNNELISEDLDQLGQKAQISYALQKSSQNTTQKDENELGLLNALQFKIAELNLGITSVNLEKLIDILEVINCTTEVKGNRIIDLLKMIYDYEAFTTNQEYQDIISLIIELQQKMIRKNQNDIEQDVLLAFEQNFIKFKKDKFATTEIVSLALSTGLMEISKIENQIDFTAVSLVYPSAILSALKQNDNTINIIVSVQQTSKDIFTKAGVDAKLLLDPITIENYQMKNGGTTFSACPPYQGIDKVSICFNGMSELQNAVCMYWDNTTMRWSTEGVSFNNLTNCCESTHFSTFGVIQYGSQTIEVNIKNPGEYGNNQLCDGLTANCLECDPETGDCLKCIGYLDPINGGCCDDLTKRIYSNQTNVWSWSCIDKSTVTELNFNPLPCDQITNQTLDEMKQFVYEYNNNSDLAKVVTQINNCQDFFNNSDLILTEIQIFNGIMKQTSIITNDTLISLTAISTTILNNASLDSILIFKSLLEFYGQAIKKIDENPGNYTNASFSTLQDNAIQCMKKLLKFKPPTDQNPNAYHLSNFYIRIGQIIPTQTLTSLLYQQKYGIQFTSDLLQSLNDGNSYYFIHAAQEKAPLSDKLAFAQYFRIYDKDFNGIDQAKLEHCGDNAPIQFQSPGSSNIIVLSAWNNGNWKNKVTCYDSNDTFVICYPATYTSQFLFIIHKDSVPLAQENCFVEDIPGCRICHSEKECNTCYYGLPLIGENYKYYGRCECPEGYYKDGFSGVNCITTENLQQTWNTTASQFGTIQSIKSSFTDLAFMVEALNNATSLKVYIQKLISLMNNSITTTEINLVLDVVNLFSQSIKTNIEEDYYQIFGKFYNYTANKSKTIDSFYLIIYLICLQGATFKYLIEVGDKIQFKLQNRLYKTNFYNLLFKNIFNTQFIHNIVPTFQLENGYIFYFQYLQGIIDYKSVTNACNLTVGTTTLEITTAVWNKIKEATCDKYEIILHEMNKNQNPYDLIQIATMYSGIVEYEILCITGQIVTVYDKLSFDSYYTIKFKQLATSETTPQCVYWDETSSSWSIDGSRSNSYTNQCEWKHFSTFAIIKSNSASIVCNSKCKTCSSYDFCLTCDSNDYLIDNMCYSSSDLTLDLVLREKAIVYIRKVSSNKYIGINTNDLQDYFELSNAAAILLQNQYTQIQWLVSIANLSNGSKAYTFTSVYLENENYKLNYSGTFQFLIQSLDNLSGNLSELYKNEGLMIPLNLTTCLTTDSSQVFTLEACNQETQSQWWEFLPKKSTEHDPIALSVETSGSDTIEIKYNHNNTQNITKAVFILAKVYPTDFDTLDLMACSSANNESKVAFTKRENDILVEVSLSDLLACGFNMLTDANNKTVISGQIIVIFTDTEQIFYYPMEIAFDSDVSIVETDVLKEASITSIQVQQGQASSLNTQFIANVKLLKFFLFQINIIFSSASSSSSSALSISGDFTLQLSLPSNISSSYSISIPATGSLININDNYPVPLQLESSNQKNTYEVQVTLPENVPDGQYRLKFSCVLTLQSNRRRILFINRFLATSQAGLIIDKSFIVTKSNSSQTNNTSNDDIENKTIYDNAGIQEESSDNSLSTGIILLIAFSGVIALALIVGIIYYALKIQKNKQMRDNIVAKNQTPTPENVEVDNLAECPNKV